MVLRGPHFDRTGDMQIVCMGSWLGAQPDNDITVWAH